MDYVAVGVVCILVGFVLGLLFKDRFIAREREVLTDLSNAIRPKD